MFGILYYLSRRTLFIVQSYLASSLLYTLLCCIIFFFHIVLILLLLVRHVKLPQPFKESWLMLKDEKGKV